MAPEESQGWTIVLMDRATRFLWDMPCGRKDRKISILKFFSLAIRAALIFQVLHSIGATHNHGVAFG
jgi:hypothetical protein